jgi:hypothetical protein
MGCLAMFLNFLHSGLGTILFTPKKVEGFIQILLSVINLILSVKFWNIFGLFIGYGLFCWSHWSTVTFMNEKSAKRKREKEKEKEIENQYLFLPSSDSSYTGYTNSSDNNTYRTNYTSSSSNINQAEESRRREHEEWQENLWRQQREQEEQRRQEEQIRRDEQRRQEDS